MEYPPDENEVCKVDCAQDDDDDDNCSNSSDDEGNDSDNDPMLSSMCFPLGPAVVATTSQQQHSNTAASTTTTQPVPIVEDAIMECLAWAIESHDKIDAVECWSPSPVSAASPHFVLDEWKPRPISALPTWMRMNDDSSKDIPADEASPPAPLD